MFRDKTLLSGLRLKLRNGRKLSRWGGWSWGTAIQGTVLICLMLGTSPGCVSVPISRSREPIPEAAINLAVLNPTTALSVIAGNDAPRDSIAEQDRLAFKELDPLQPGEDTVVTTSSHYYRGKSVRRSAKVQMDSIAYLTTSRGFESPPIDPLSQTSVFDRPLYQW